MLEPIAPAHDLDLRTRRTFLADLGKGALAVAVLGIAGCSPATGSPSPSPATSAGGPGSVPPNGDGTSPSGAGGGSPAAPSGGGSTASGGPLAPGGTAWTRVNLGFVSAYLLIRDGEGTIVDTGVAGSEGAIQAAMDALNLGWSDVGNVILTHKHPDHAGSINPILEAAKDASGWIGEADLSAVQTSRPLQPLKDGDEVFGLTIVATPGHTVGHISVYDEVGRILVAGDALRTDSGSLSGSNPQFTEDATAAQASVVKLGKLTFETLLVGHGEPILSGASAQVKALAG